METLEQIIARLNQALSQDNENEFGSIFSSLTPVMKLDFVNSQQGIDLFIKAHGQNYEMAQIIYDNSPEQLGRFTQQDTQKYLLHASGNKILQNSRFGDILPSFLFGNILWKWSDASRNHE